MKIGLQSFTHTYKNTYIYILIALPEQVLLAAILKNEMHILTNLELIELIIITLKVMVKM